MISHVSRIYAEDVDNLGFPRTPSLLHAANEVRKNTQPDWLFLPRRVNPQKLATFLLPTHKVVPSDSRVLFEFIGIEWSIDQSTRWVSYEFACVDLSLQRHLCDACKSLLALTLYDDSQDYQATCGWPPEYINADLGVRDRMTPLIVNRN